METMEQHGNDVDIRALLGMLQRQYRLILMVCVLALGLAGLYLFQSTPLYRSSVLVIVDPSRKNLMEAADPQMMNGSSESSRIESEVTIIKSDKVLLTTIKLAGLVTDEEFGPRLGLMDKIRLALGLEVKSDQTPAQLTDATLGRLRNAVTVQRQGLTYILRIGVSSQSREKAAQIANTLAQTYIELQLASKREGVLGSSELLQAQLDSARSALSQSEEQLDGYIRANIERISSETGDSELTTLSNRVQQLETDRLARELRQKEAGAALEQQDWTRLADSLGNQAIRALENERSALERRLRASPAGGEAEIDLRSQLAELDKEINAIGTSAINALRDEMSSLTSTSNEMRQNLRTRILGAELAPMTLTAIYELQQEADIVQRQYTTLLSRMRDLETQAALQVADSRIVSEALPPQAPYAPNTKLVLALALLLGLGAGVGIALLNEFHLGGVISASQLANLIPVPVLATVPRVDQQADQLSVSDNISDAPFSAYAEAFRKLRAGLDRLTAGVERGRVILVCSAVPGEGKTSTALSLARTYALSGKRTLLIDADLRKPSLHHHLGVTPKQGFLDFLTTQEDSLTEEGFYTIDPKSHAALILGRGRPAAPTDQMLQSSVFEDLIARARGALDVIIIDTSPVIPVVDVRYIAQHADALVLVARYATSAQSDTRECFEQLRASVRPNVPMAAVLNIDEAGTQRYRYRDYYVDYTTG